MLALLGWITGKAAASRLFQAVIFSSTEFCSFCCWSCTSGAHCHSAPPVAKATVSLCVFRYSSWLSFHYYSCLWWLMRHVTASYKPSNDHTRGPGSGSQALYVFSVPVSWLSSLLGPQITKALDRSVSSSCLWGGKPWWAIFTVEYWCCLWPGMHVSLINYSQSKNIHLFDWHDI